MEQFENEIVGFGAASPTMVSPLFGLGLTAIAIASLSPDEDAMYSAITEKGVRDSLKLIASIPHVAGTPGGLEVAEW